MASVLFEPVYLAGQFYHSAKEVKDNYPGYDTLVQKYFKKGWNRGGVENVNVPSKKDRETLVVMIKERIAEMKRADKFGSSIYTRGTVANSRTQKVVQELEALLKALEFYGKKGSSGEVITNAQKIAELKEIAEISDQRPFEILFEHAWNLLHPENIDDDVRQAWLKLLRHSRDNPIDVILSHVKTMQDAKPPLNYLKNTNIIKHIQKEGATLESAAANTLKEFKESAGKIKKQADLQKRLMRVFDIMKVMSVISAAKQTEANTVIKEDDDDKLGAMIETLPAEIANQMDAFVKPVFSYYETHYAEAYKSIEAFVNGYKDFPIDGVLRLMQAAKQTRLNSPQEGLVKIPNSAADVKDITELLNKYAEGNKSVANSFVEDTGNPSANRTALSSGARIGDTVLMQYITGVELPDAQATITGLVGKINPKSTDAKLPANITANLTDFFSKDAVYMLVQKIPGPSEKMKSIDALPGVLRYPTKKEDTDKLKSYMGGLYNVLTAADKPTLGALGVTTTTNTIPLVQSITDRLLSLMAVLYFKKILGEAANKAEAK